MSYDKYKKYPLKIGFLLGIIFTLIYTLNLFIYPPGINFFGNYIIGIPQSFLHGLIMGTIITTLSLLVSEKFKQNSSKGGAIGVTLSIIIVISNFFLPNRVHNDYIQHLIITKLIDSYLPYLIINWIIWVILWFLIGFLIGKFIQNKKR